MGLQHCVTMCIFGLFIHLLNYFTLNFSIFFIKHNLHFLQIFSMMYIFGEFTFGMKNNLFFIDNAYYNSINSNKYI